MRRKNKNGENWQRKGEGQIDERRMKRGVRGEEWEGVRRGNRSEEKVGGEESRMREKRDSRRKNGNWREGESRKGEMGRRGSTQKWLGAKRERRAEGDGYDQEKRKRGRNKNGKMMEKGNE